MIKITKLIKTKLKHCENGKLTHSVNAMERVKADTLYSSKLC